MRFLFCLISIVFTLPTSATTIKILSEDSFPPYSYIENKKVVGLSVEIITAAFASQNIKVTFEGVPFSRCLAKIKSGLGLGCFNSTYDPTALDSLIFPKYPLAIVKAVALTHIDNLGAKVNKVHDLQGSTVVITLGYSYGPEFDYDKKIEKHYANSDSNVMKVVSTKRTRYGVLNLLTYHFLRQSQPYSVTSKIKNMGPIGTGGLYVMFGRRHKEGEKYARLYDKGMQQIIKSGKYEQILKKWGQRLGISREELQALSAKNPDPFREGSDKDY